MKKTIIKVAILALLGAFAVSCQKEAAPVTSSVCSQSEYNVRYSIDNRIYHANLQSSEEWHTFLSDMLALARQGHRITIQKPTSSNQTAAPKEIKTHETDNYDDAIAWMKMMIELGYEVTIEYDEETGIYIVTAII
jgi:hypothetical protein